MFHDFLNQTGNTQIIVQYDLQPFQINVLDKKQTLLEKLASLIRFSLDENPVESIKNKIKHFYDIYYLINDTDCNSFSKTKEFKTKFNELLIHDKEIFDEPVGWKNKSIYDSLQNPEQTGHPFRFKADTRSGAKRTPIPF